MTLYELTEQALILQDMAENEDIDPEVLRDTLEAVAGEYDVKIEAYCKIIRNLEAEAKAIAEEEKRFAARRKSLEGNVSRMKAAVMDSMKATGRAKAGGILTASIRKNGGKLPVVYDVDLAELPEAFVTYEPKVNTEAVRDYLDTTGENEWFSITEREGRA